MQVKELIDHRRNKSRFTAAAQAGDREAQMTVNPTIDQRIEFTFKSLHLGPSLPASME